MIGFEHYNPRQWLSISSLVNFKRCPRRFFYGSGCRLVLPSKHPALCFGEAIHAAIPAITGGDQSIPKEERLKNSLSIFASIWGDTQGDDTRNLENAARVLSDFADAHGPDSLYQLLEPPVMTDDTGVCLSDRVSKWEIPFAISIPGLRVPLVGRIDGLCRMRHDQSIWGLEYKTSRQLGSTFFEGFGLSPQIIAYTLALRTYVPNTEVRGCIVEGIRTSKTNSASTAIPILVLDHHIENFISWARWNGNLILSMEERGEFPPDYAGCHPYAQFGVQGFPCDYTQLCKHTEDWTALKDCYVVKDDRPFVLIKPTIEGREPVSV